MRYIVAVSGGVDSVVLLDKLARAGEHELIVAHAEHGIRDDSADDARFVAGLAKEYGCIYKEKKLNLGARASEERARQERYKFLLALAKKYKATVVTAHHADDLAETVAINLKRGTGWRGLGVLARKGVKRPLIELSKEQIYEYALKNRLEYVEDKTNRDKRYLRNRVRCRLRPRLTKKARKKLLDLRNQQVALKAAVEGELAAILGTAPVSRYLLIQVDATVAMELLNAAVKRAADRTLTRPQLERALLAVKTAKPNTTYSAGSGVKLRFTSRFFSVEML